MRQGDKETRRQGDKETRRQGDKGDKGRVVAKSHNQSIEVDWETRGLGDGEIKANF